MDDSITLLNWEQTPQGGHIAHLGREIVGSVGKRRYFDGDPRCSDDEPFRYYRLMLYPNGWDRTGECDELDDAMKAVEDGVAAWIAGAGLDPSGAGLRDELKSMEQAWDGLKTQYSELAEALGFEHRTWFDDPLESHEEILARAREAGRAWKMMHAMDADEFWQKLSDHLDDHLDDYGYLHYASNAEDRARIAAFLRRRVLEVGA